MKKKRLVGFRARKLGMIDRVVRVPEQLDLFQGDWFFHEGKLLYVSQKANVASSESKAF